MEYSQVVQGKFIRRMNRFVAEVEIDGRIETVHVKNTGRCKELLVPGARVYMETSDNKARKYRHSLIAVEKDDMLVNIDSQAPNAVVYEALQDGMIPELGRIQTLKREVVYGGSRFDLYFESDKFKKGFMEVKGVTLELNGVAMFPDAPTARGRKHVLELIDAVKEGYTGMIMFLIQMKGPAEFTPHAGMDLPFAEALKEAVDAGVRVYAYDSAVTGTAIQFGKPIPVNI